MKVYLASTFHSLEEEVERVWQIGSVKYAKTMPQVPDHDSGLYRRNTATNIFSLSDFNRTIDSMIIQLVPEESSTEEHNTAELLQRVNKEAGKSYGKYIPTFKV